VPARRPGWISHSELFDAAEMYHSMIDRDLVTISTDPDEVRSRVRRLIKSPIEFIDNESFGEKNAHKSVFAETLDLEPSNTELGLAAIRKAGVDLPIHLGRLCEAKLLKSPQDQILFRRMNFLKHQAEMHRQLLLRDRPSRVRLHLIEELVVLSDWHRDRLVEANMRLVFSIVKKFVNPNNVFDDLLSDGIVALMRAVEKFDYDRGFRFSTYATQVVRRNAYRTVVENQQERQKMVGGIQEMGIDVSEEIREPNMSESRWHELRSRLTVMLGDLDRREKLIIRARFSLGSHRRVHTLQSLANRLGVSKERVRQLEKRAMEKLRAMAGDLPLTGLEPS
ncbi:MAG: sigma-70 family RNA polymerase sigma factor, partial [Planctomycetota bacterium]